jgi:hypothetical protein
MTTTRASFTLDEEAFAFLRDVGGRNKSAFINTLLKKERQRYLQKKILSANLEEAGDAAYQEELGDWDAALPDGLDQ